MRCTLLSLVLFCVFLSNGFAATNTTNPGITSISPPSAMMTDATIYLSSNTQQRISIFDIEAGVPNFADTYTNVATDADGIYFDEATDVLYQVNRADNTINAYSNFSTNPTLTATSSANDFINGREMTRIGNKLIVAQDASPANGEVNKFVVFDFSPTSITFDKELEVTTNLWGIQSDGNDLWAVVDNSNMIAVFEDVLSDVGTSSPDKIISIDNLVRTHGLTYDTDEDLMILTDIGEASMAGDGALVVIADWTTVSADNNVSAAEQIRVSGGSSLLGNPVDVAYARGNQRIYVAERAREGGLLLGFEMPVASGGIAPAYSAPFAGAAAIFLAPGAGANCDAVVGGFVSLTAGGTSTTIFVDGQPDVISFSSSFAMGGTYTYVVTDANGVILGIPPGNMNDFDPAGLGACLVYGLSYTGNLLVDVGDNLTAPDTQISDDCFSLSINHLVVNRIEPADAENTFYVSSNTSGNIGVFDITANNDVTMTMEASVAMDADGIYYDEDNDVLYQLNRSESVINAYSNFSANPTLTATSSSDFSNGREIAFVSGKIVVADDVTDANKFVIYNASANSITLDKTLSTDINLWGIHAVGNDLFAVVDNSSMIARFDDFFDNADGANVTATSTAAIEGLVRTHGITYIPEVDMMLLTDVGSAASATDGALVRVKNYTTAAADGTVTAAEQIRVSGGASFLGNPVDIAYDRDNQIVYVAERANGGGRVLGYRLPVATGGIAPVYNKIFAGASAIHFPGGMNPDFCEDVVGGTVSLATGGTSTTIFVDGQPDVISFNSTNAMGGTFTYVVTDANGVILGIPPGNMNDFDPAGLGACLVYGLSYTGNLLVGIGDNLTAPGTQISDDCFSLSSNNLVVNRIAPAPAVDNFYVSSNTSGTIGVFSITADGDVTMGMEDSEGIDADGIYYDEANDVLYQLNRSASVINAFSNFSTNPMLTATSTSDFMNGREIAFAEGKIIVADDVTDANKFVIYDASANAITLDKTIDTDINLWGVHAEGGTLYAVVDNSSDLAIFNDFFDNADGSTVTADQTVTIEGLVRTHGITYIPESDMMLLTDVGSAASATDGALVRIRNFNTVAADGTVTAAEQIRVAGGTSRLGNPVDLAYDRANKIVYVAERANGGGQVLGYRLPVATGGIAPIYVKAFPGASAINITGAPAFDPCAGNLVNGGSVTLSTGETSTTIFVDGQPDVLMFNSTGASGGTFTYVITDADGMILGIPPGNMNDFDPAGLGACLVYGLSYTGNLLVSMGDNLTAPGTMISDECFSLSSNRLVVNRIAPTDPDTRLFVSTNTDGVVGTFNTFQNNLNMSMFPAGGVDADGVFYDGDTDALFQINRTDNTVNAYSNATSGNPTITATSTSDFINGRGLSASGGQLVVAVDATIANGNNNKFVIYDYTPDAITYNKEYGTNVDLWGIQAIGSTLWAVVDNSNLVARFDNFFDNGIGSVVDPDFVFSVEGLVRTHGITYDVDADIMILTDIGDAASAGDGALVVIQNFTSAIGDAIVSTDEQIRVSGGGSFLGNPVDVAYDREFNRIYVAERARDGGRLLGFEFPRLTGGISPVYNKPFAGASSVTLFNDDLPAPCATVQGGMIELEGGGTETTITVNDGIDDFITFSTDVNPVGFDFTYVITDANGIILGFNPGGTQNFEPAGTGACLVWGFSYTGNILVEIGDDLFNSGDLTDFCFDLSDNNLTINREDVNNSTPSASFYVSSNNSGDIGFFDYDNNGQLILGTVASGGTDADGIFYDEDNDVLYQLNRTNNRIDLFTNVSSDPQLTASSSSDFVNGREIAVSNGKLVVAVDASVGNGNNNKFVIYDITPTSITYDKEYGTGINLWGIHAVGTTLYAVVDNSNGVARFDDFFNNTGGSTVAPTATVAVSGLIRTHGLTYDMDADLMILTDIGDAAAFADGALVVINNWMTAAADNMISTAEQVRVSGGSSFLGNPVDVAYDKDNNRVFVAERGRDGGRVLGFNFPVATGGIAPIYNVLFPGASAIHFPHPSVDNLMEPTGDIRTEETVKSIVPSRIYPVPATFELNIELESLLNQETTIHIMDVTGALVTSRQVTLNEGFNLINLNVAGLSAGMHFIQIPQIGFITKVTKLNQN